MTRDFTKPNYADGHEWKRGLWLIAGITCVPTALLAIARVLMG